MKIFHLASLNNDPEIQPNMGPKCNPVGGEPHMNKGCPVFLALNAEKSTF